MVYSPEFGTCRTDREQSPFEGLSKRQRHTPHDAKDANRIGMSCGFRKNICCAAVAVSVFSVTVAVSQAQSASTWNKRGQKAEVREDYDAAYEAYRQAHLKAPADVRYKERLERIRFQAAAAHVDRGRVLRQNGDFQGALTEFARALMIDPGDQAAQQETDITLKQQGVATVSPIAVDQTKRSSDVVDSIGAISGIAELKPVSNDPITLHMVEDTKVIYQAIGKAAGLNVLFDPDYASKRIPIDLTNVSLSDALRIVGTIAGTFYKVVTPNTIFVAQNSRAKRTDLDEVAVQTFYLTNSSQQADATEVLTAIRNLLDPTVKVYLVPSQNAIVMRATPDQLLLAQKLINDLDRAKPEVVVDVAVLQVNRDKVRNLGIQLPQSITLTPQVANSTSTSGGSTGTGTTTPTTSANLTLNNLAHLNSNNFGVAITGGTLNALLTDSDTRVLQNPRVRATDGQRAQLKIGSRIPVATGSYNAGVSTGVASIGVQTQFTYLDIGVNIDMTPTVHYDREVSMKLRIEISSQANTVNISGVNEPVIAQDVVEQTIQLKEGEPSILAGLLEKDDLRSLSGTPGLAELPLLRYIFGSNNHEVRQNEIVFVLIPHIVRESVLTRLNTRAIDTGTGTTVELRRDPNPRNDADFYVEPMPVPRTPPITAANAASAMAAAMQRDATRPTPPSATVTDAPVAPTRAVAPAPAASQVSLSMTSPSGPQAVGSTFQVPVMLAGGHDIYAVPLQVKFDPALLDLVNVDAGDFLGKDGQAVAIVHRDEGNGLITISTSRPPGVAGVEGQGTVCVLTFKAKAAGDSNLTMVRVGAKNSAQANLPAVGSQAVVHVK